MNANHSFDRRRFLQSSSLAAAAGVAASHLAGFRRSRRGRAQDRRRDGRAALQDAQDRHDQGAGGFEGEFAAAKEARIRRRGTQLRRATTSKEVRAAIAGTGLPVDGTVCASHWKHSPHQPDA